MIHHRTPREVKRFDIFKIIIFIILVILLLLCWFLFRPLENPPTSAQITAEPAATDTSTATGPEVTPPPTEASTQEVENSPTSAPATTEPATNDTSTDTEPEVTPPPTEASTQEVENSPAVAQATPEPTVEISPTSAVAESTPEAVVAPTINLPDGEVTPGEVMLSGTGEPGSEIEIVVDGQAAGKTTVNSDGTWSLAVDLPDAGDYEVSVQSLDSDGQVVAASEPVSLTVVAAAVAPTLDQPDELTAGSITVSGSGEPGSQIQVLVDGKPVGTATVDSDGTWSLPFDLSDAGDYEVTVQSVDADGQVIAAADPVQIEVTAPTIAAPPTLDVPDSDLTVGQVTLTGSGEPGASVEIVIDGQVVGTVTVDSTGKWSFPAEFATAGDHEIIVQSVDTAGQVVASSGPVTVMVGADAGAVAAAPSTEGDDQAYIVQADDWLSKLSLKFYGDIAKYPVIVDATNAKAQEDSTFTVIANPDLIEIGQKLWIPAAAP